MGLRIFISLSILLLVLVKNSMFSAASPALRIVNGDTAGSTDAKYQISIRRRLGEASFFGAGHICGGALISPSVALTATHCFINVDSEDKELLPASDFIAVMGTLNKSERTPNTLVYDISRLVFRNSSFSVDNYIDDIALAFLSGSVPENHPTVETIPINRAPMPDVTLCVVTGWGQTQDDPTPLQLRRVLVHLIADHVCKHDTTFDDVIYPGMICAGYMAGGKDTCSGDSGGPLVCRDRLVGVVSWTKSCGEPTQPGVYSDVQFYASWIEAQVTAANITLS